MFEGLTKSLAAHALVHSLHAADLKLISTYRRGIRPLCELYLPFAVRHDVFVNREPMHWHVSRASRRRSSGGLGGIGPGNLMEVDGPRVSRITS